MDPQIPDCNVPKNIFSNFSYCYKKVLPTNKIHWINYNNNYPTQKDSFNCGMFVIHYIQEILNQNSENIPDFDTMTMRENLKQKCVEKSLNSIS